MYKSISLFLLSFFLFVTENADAQTTTDSVKLKEERFYSITRNKAWSVSKFYITSKQSDKKSSFSNSTFRFNQDDTSKFIIENVGTDNMIGHWNNQDNNRVMFSLPLIAKDSSYLIPTATAAATDSSKASSPQYKVGFHKNTPGDSTYNEVAKMLSGAPLQMMEITPTKLKFKMLDAMRGEVLVEFLRKE